MCQRRALATTTAFAGTSAAAPQVAGLAALLLARSPTFPVAPSELTNDDLRWIIKTSADRVWPRPGDETWAQEYGSGRINMGAALRYLYPPYHITHMSVNASPTVALPDTQTRSLYFPFRNVRHHVRAVSLEWNADLPAEIGPDDTVIAVWGRKETGGWALPETAKLTTEPPNGPHPGPYVFEDGYCANVSTDPSHPRLRTYAYEVIDPGHNLWYLPRDPIQQGVTFEYTVLWRPKAWAEMADVPAGARNRSVKDGGCLAYSGDDGNVYALKGNVTCEFCRYNTATDDWTARESIPAIGWSGRKKVVRKASALAAAEGKVYAAKGGNTSEWWAYAPTTNTWAQLSDVPSGAQAGHRRNRGHDR